MKLYYLPGACSLACHIALEWTKADYQAIKMAREDLKTEEYLQLNPVGSVPCLQDGDFVICQNIAILDYLDAKYREAKIFAGQDLKLRAKVMQWLSFCNSDLHKAFVPLFAPMKFLSNEENFPDLQNHAKQSVKGLLQIVEQNLQKQDYLAGEKSIADVYLLVCLGWCKLLQLDVSEFANLGAFVERMASDVGVQRAMQMEGLI